MPLEQNAPRTKRRRWQLSCLGFLKRPPEPLHAYSPHKLLVETCTPPYYLIIIIPRARLQKIVIAIFQFLAQLNNQL